MAADVESGLTALADLGLVGRTTEFQGPEPPVGCTMKASGDERWSGAPDDRLAVHVPQRVRADGLTAVGYPKRLALDTASRAVLGLPESHAGDLDPAELRADVVRLSGDVGPVTRMVLPTYVERAELHLERLDARAALVALLASTFNGVWGQNRYTYYVDDTYVGEITNGTAATVAAKSS